MFECAQNFFENFASYYLKMEENSEGESYFFKYRHTYDVVDYMKQLVRDKKEKDLYCRWPSCFSAYYFVRTHIAFWQQRYRSGNFYCAKWLSGRIYRYDNGGDS